MSLSKLALTAAIAAACGTMAFAPQAKAADGTITFTGKVIDQTCSLTGPASTNGNFTVTLPNVVKGTDITNTAGTTAGATPFSMKFDGCPTYANISVLFSGAGIDPGAASSGLLSNASGTGYAADVAVQLTDSSNNPLDLSNTTDAAAQGTAFQTPDPNSGQATFPYTARYYVTGAGLTGGNVSATVDYTVVYQ